MNIEEIEREILRAIDIEIDMSSHAFVPEALHEEETKPLRDIRRFVVLLFKESKEE